MMLIVALQTGSPEANANARMALDSMQHNKELAYRVIDTDGQPTGKWKKIDIDFVAISGTETARAASHDVG
jgi:hypothetical protein